MCSEVMRFNNSLQCIGLDLLTIKVQPTINLMILVFMVMLVILVILDNLVDMVDLVKSKNVI